MIAAGYEPEYGRTSGGLALFGMRSGSNQMRGTVHEFLRDDRFDNNGFNAIRAGQRKQNFSRNQFGSTVGGPVRLPGFDGHDRTFFFFAYEGLRETSAGSYTGTVPTALERAGDFSQTRDASGQLIAIYDPRTTRLDPARPAGTTRYIRDPFPDNRIPVGLLNPIALNILSRYPLPNQRGDGLSNSNNYFSNAPSGLDTDRVDLRVDHNLTTRNRLVFRFNDFQNRITNPDVYGTGMTLVANNRIPGINGMARHTLVAGSSFVFEHHFSYALSQSNRTSSNLGFDSTSLGFPQSVIAGNPITSFPIVTLNRAGQLGTNVTFERNQSQVFQYLANASWLRGRHMVKGGVDIRAFPIRINTAPQLAIRATSNFTGGPNPQAAAAASGSGVADLLLGAATVSNGVYEPEYYDHRYYAVYLQDEFRATRALTLTYGLRYNIELPWTERQGYLVQLDLESPSPIAAQLPQLNLKGGVGFVGAGEPIQKADKNNFDPRVGAAWRWNDQTVVHGGLGVFHHPSPAFLSTGTSVGSSRTTTSVATEADTVTPLFNLNNPFPTGLLPAIGSSQGLSTLLGQNIAGARPDQKISYQVNWSADIQRELPGSIVLTVGYSGNVGRNLLSPVNLNQIPDSALAQGTQLLQQVPNPFFGVITDPTSILSRPTVQAGQLLRAYPQFQNVTAALSSVGRSRYDALQLTLDRRFSNGLGMVFAYTKSRTTDNVGEVGLWAGDATGFQNNNCFECDRSISLQDVPDVLRWSVRYDFPFGPGHGRLERGPLAQVIGGWAVASFVQWDNGTPLRLSSPNDSNSFGGGTNMRPTLTGESPELNNRGPLTDGALYFNTAAFSRTLPFAFGNAPRALEALRNPGARNVDLLVEKRVGLPGRSSIDLRVEVFNLFNFVQYAGPGTNIVAADFGRVFLRQVNIPRQIQLGARVSF